MIAFLKLLNHLKMASVVVLSECPQVRGTLGG